LDLGRLSILYWETKDYDSAQALSQQAETLARKIKHEPSIAMLLHDQGIMLARANRKQEAFTQFGESLNIMRRIGNASGMADNLGELGKLYLDAGMIREAIAAFNEALEIFQRQGDPKMGITLSLMGDVHEQQGEYAAALEKYQQALSIFQQVGMAREVQIAQQDIARVRAKLGQ
jgi:tetratricopeptide (TPR) repeat protein